MLVLLLVTACGETAEAPPPRVALDPLERARRVSLAVRGLPLTEAEIDRVLGDASALPELVAEWLETDAFGETVRDLHQDLYWMRVDTEFEFPARGPLVGTTPQAINAAVGEGPLKLIEEVVRSDLPYSDVLAVDWTMVNPVLATVYGLAHDPSGPTWQRAPWNDDRPPAGVLSDNGMWLRFRSSDTNFERERANAITRIFLCQDFASADLPVLADNGVFTLGGTGPLEESTCSSCHGAIDPIGSYLWGFRRYILAMEVELAYASECEGEEGKNCYPFQLWDSKNQDLWAELGMPAPSLFGDPGDDLTDLGQSLSEHPAFPSCTTRNFASWLTQTPASELPAERVTAWTEVFESSGRSAKELVTAIVLDDAFATMIPDEGGWAPGLQHVRPEQWARSVEQLTGFRFLAHPTESACEAGTDACWGEVDLLRSDRYGFRLLMGGISGYQVTDPTLGPTPTRELAMQRAAFEAAGTVVAADLSLPPDQRRLLGATADEIDEGAVRTELVHLHRVILGADHGLWDAEISASRQLFYDTHEDATLSEAWTAVVAGLLLHPAMMAY